MKRAIEYYGFVAVGSIAAIIMLYVLLIPQPALPHFAAIAIAPKHAPLPSQAPPRSGVPNRIVISTLGLDIPVKIGRFDESTGAWTVSDDAAFFANASVPANDRNGTTLIYGHARWGIFGALPDMQRGVEAEIYTDTGYRFKYRYVSMKDVVPTDTSVFTNEGKPTMVLQTCTGPWDSYRALYTFSLVEGRKV